MMKLALTIGALSTLLAAPAFASLDCNGLFFDYNFHVTAETANNQVTGPVTIAVSQDGEPGQSGQMNTTSSAIVVGKSLNLRAQDNDGDTLTLDATFQGGAYSGQMSIGNSQGTATPDMVCKVL